MVELEERPGFEVVFTVSHESWVVVLTSINTNNLLVAWAVGYAQGNFSEVDELLVGAVGDAIGVATEVVDGVHFYHVSEVLVDLLFSNHVVLNSWLDGLNEFLALFVQESFSVIS